MKGKNGRDADKLAVLGPAKLAPDPLLVGARRFFDRPVLPDAGSVLHGMKPVSELGELTGQPKVFRRGSTPTVKSVGARRGREP